MQKIYTIAADLSAQGHTLLARDNKRIMPTKTIKPADFARRVTFDGSVMYVDGQPANGWTVCVKG
jgi:hypothetical protein